MLPSILAASETRSPRRHPMPPTAERMSRVDTAWLRMDNDVNLMMIVGVWLLQPGITHEALCERVEDKLLKYARFRQKVVQDAMGATWVDDEDFDIAPPRGAREARAQARARANAHALQARAGELANTRARPGAPAVAVPPDRALRRRQRADRARPPLHRRRHRADLGDDVDHRRRHGPAAAQEARAPDRRRRATGCPTRCSSR